MESKGSFEYSKGVIGELRGKTEGLVGGIEESLGPEGCGGVEGHVEEVGVEVDGWSVFA
jgi:geranylgeranyl diphosphate synthase type 3